MNNPAYESALAIVGMAGRFPLARNLEEFWRNLRDGRCSITFLSDQELQEAGIESDLRENPSYVKAAMLLADIGFFDSDFFGFTPREAEVTDPQHRFFLECAWEALEDAGYSPSGSEESIGVWAGASESSYLKEIDAFPDRVKALGHLRVMLGNTKDHLPTWVSYKLNLKGPSVNVQTACSTSLVAVHMACQSLLNGECDLALAGGVSIHVRQRQGYLYQEGGILAPDGYCRAFDARAEGTVSGNGVGIVALRRLEDAVKAGDRIRAVIRGSAINNDGALKLGYTAPSLEGQARAISEALALADVEPSGLSYIEAHGTGTPLGDPIEIKALTQAFRAKTEASGFCAVGSVKPNIGHLDAAAGIAGLIKTVLALEHGEIPPSLHFEEPNPQIDFASSPFYVNDALRAWQPNGRLRQAGVSSFGMGGTNAHIILEEAPEAEPTDTSRGWHLLVASAKTPGALDAVTERLANRLGARREAATTGPDIADIAFTLQLGRARFDHRRVWVCRDLADAREALSVGSDRAWSTACSRQLQPVAFLFPGQGTQSVGMTAELYQQEPVFQRTMDRCAEILSPHLGFDLRGVLYPSADGKEEATARMDQTACAQPALFSVEYALAQLWLSWGVQPQAMIGHSLGEYVAACLAGVFSLEDALALVARRGRLMQTLPPGAMLALPLAGEELQASLGGDLSLAAINAPVRCVVSGPTDAIETLEREMTERGVKGLRLRTSHGFHSAMVEPILKEFASAVGKVDRQAPRIPFVSNLSGRWITATQAKDPQYWAQHLRGTIRFAEGLGRLLEDPGLALLEVGPGRTLSGFCTSHPAFRSSSHEALASLAPFDSGRGEAGTILRTLGRLWLAGVEVDWTGFHAGERRRRVALPTYPFERRRYLLGSEMKTDRSPERGGAENSTTEGARRPGENGDTPRRRESLEKRDRTMDTTQTMPEPPDRKEVILTVLKDVVAELTGVTAERINTRMDFLETGVDSLLLIQAVQLVYERLGVKVSFIQLLEELSDIDRLADYLDKEIPSGETPGVLADLMARPGKSVEPEALDLVLPSSQEPTGEWTPDSLQQYESSRSLESDLTAPSPTLRAQSSSQDFEMLAARGGTLEQVVLQQTALMQQHLELLRAARGVAPGTAATRPPAASPATTNRQSPVPLGRRKEIETFSPYRPLDRRQRGLTARQREHLDAFITRYERRTWKSKQHIQAYRPVLADGRMTARFRWVFKELIYPIVGSRSAGSRIWDIDGNEYLDIGMGFGLHHFGHSPDFVRQAQERRLAQGLELGPHSSLCGRAAELVCELSGQDRATFCNSGTEAVMCALRLARIYTRRQKVVLFSGAYHGWSDSTLARPRVNDGELTSIPEAPGVSANTVKDVLVLPWDSQESLAMIRDRAHEIAAVMVEPVQSRRPDIQPRSFLKELRQITAEAGVALIFDEMVTGCRLLPGGAQAWFDIDADLVIYGKVLAGGLPLGVVAGKSALMDFLDGGMWAYGDESYPPNDKTVFSGSYFKHPLTMATAVAILEQILAVGEAAYRQLNERTQRLTDSLNAVMQECGLPVTIANCGALFRFLFPRQHRWSQIFYYHLLDRGIHVSPEVGSCFLSFAHTDAEVDFITEMVRDTVIELQEAELLPANPSVERVGRRPRPDLPPVVAATGATPFCSTSEDPLAPPQPVTEEAPDTDRVAVSEVQEPEPVSDLPEAAGRTGAENEKPLPLTDGQHQLWLMAQMGDELSRAYNEATVFRFRGPFDRAAMTGALQEIVNRHQALRMTFSPDGKTQRLTVRRALAIPFDDLADSTAEERAASLEDIFRRQVEPAFDLENGPLFRVHLIRLAEDDHLLTFTLHHLIIDGWSLGILIEELQGLYSSIHEARPMELASASRFSGYVKRLRQTFQDESTQSTAAAYWREQLVEAPEALELPGDRPRPRLETFANVRHCRVIELGAYQELKRFCRAQRVTLFMLLLAGYNALLHRLTGQRDIVTGFAMAAQPSLGEEGVVGYCINLVPLRSKLGRQTSFLDYLTLIKRQVASAEKYQSYPLLKLLKQLQRSGDPSIGALGLMPLFRTSLSLDREGAITGFSDLDCEISRIPPVSAKLDLYLNPVELSPGLRLECDYKSDLFDEVTIHRWMRHFETLLVGAAADPSQPMKSLGILSSRERQQLLIEWNATTAQYPHSACIHELFEVQVARHAESIAATYELDQSLSYGELNRLADRVACALRSQDVRPEVLVGLYMERSLEVIVGMLGILKAGGVYLPLDPTHPQERLAMMLQDAGVRLLLAREDSLPQFSGGVNVVGVERLMRHGDGTVPIKSYPPARSENLAYAIYTSGSTGRPKGTLLTHRGLSNLTQAQRQRFGLQPGRRVLQFSSLSFDASLFEIAVGLASGATVCLSSPGDLLPDRSLLRRLLNQKIYWMVLPPSALSVLEPAELPALGAIAVAGEDCPAELVRQWAPGRRLWNAYGPTEATIWVTGKRCVDGGHKPSIGRPLENVQVYLLDPLMQPLPVGLPGELYLAGVGLARGYIGHPGLTAERFVPDPFGGIEGARVYRTGDLARYLPDGELDFLGRIDKQVKIRGFRVELSEVEAVLGGLRNVREAVVELRGAGSVGADGAKRLVAYVVPEGESTPSPRDLRSFLEQRLPSYMIPAAFVLLESLPRTPSGKVDRQALPEFIPDRTAVEEDLVAPRDDVEEKLAAIWAPVLGVEQVGVHDNFFELGGDSILAIQIVSKANRAGFNLRPRQIFTHQTIAELVAEQEGTATRADQGFVTGPVPLTPIQRWFLEQDSPEPHFFNLARMFELRDHPDSLSLEKAVRLLVSQHDALRLRLFKEATGWAQVNKEPGDEEVPFHQIDLAAIGDRRSAIEEAAAQVQTSLDLTHGPLLRVVFFESGDQESDQLLIVSHHLITDNVSSHILLEDLFEAFLHILDSERLRLTSQLRLPLKTSSFKQWAEKLTELAQSGEFSGELAYWEAQLAASQDPLPVDFPEGANAVDSVRDISVALDADETRALLQDVPKIYGSQINEVLLAALMHAFERWTGKKSLLVDLEGHGREEEFIEGMDLSRTVGWFTSLFPVLLRRANGGKIEETLALVQESLRGIPRRGLGYGVLRFLNPEAGERLRALPKPEVSFNYLGQLNRASPQDLPVRPSGMSIGRQKSSLGLRQHLLEINGLVGDDNRLHWTWTYSADRHRRTSVRQVAWAFIQALRELVAQADAGEESWAANRRDFSWKQKDIDDIATALGRATESTDS